MKIQLLQDIEDSGAMPRLPQAMVWHRTQAGAGKLGSRPWTTEPARPRADAGPVTGTRDGTQTGSNTGTGPFQPPPHARAEPAASREPDWLIELMREDAERAGELSRAGRWKRRIVTWTVAASAFAVVAAGALWVYEDRRVDGALVMVAETAPPATAAAASVEPAAATPTASPLPAAPAAAPVSPATPVSAPDYSATQNIVVPVRPPPSIALENAHPAAPAVRHERAAAKARPASAPAAQREVPSRLRREETLLQCRALGYDEAQCIRKGCTMTRFGLACRG